jgi:uncharacterized protein YkwD
MYLKDDPAKEPLAASYSAPGVLAEAAHKTGRAKADFELRQISKEQYERVKELVLSENLLFASKINHRVQVMRQGEVVVCLIAENLAAGYATSLRILPRWLSSV